MRIDKNAYGVVFAVVGIAAVILIGFLMFLWNELMPVVRDWVLWFAGPQAAFGIVIGLLMGLAIGIALMKEIKL